MFSKCLNFYLSKAKPRITKRSPAREAAHREQCQRVRQILKNRFGINKSLEYPKDVFLLAKLIADEIRKGSQPARRKMDSR